MTHAMPAQPLPPATTAYPGALGGGILIHTAEPLSPGLRADIAAIIDGTERALSRFRPDSLVARIAREPQGGRFDFPAWAAPLFAYCTALNRATGGRFDPCIGADLIRLGYSASFSCAAGPTDVAPPRLARHTWTGKVECEGATLVTHGPVQLDFGACGKGLCIDRIANALAVRLGPTPCMVDAGGDLSLRGLNGPIAIALEDPHDPDLAVGVTHIADASLCASAPSRRNWRDAAGNRVHHLLNALTGAPADGVAATWVSVPSDATPYPTMVADGVATALFVTPPDRLATWFPGFDCLVLDGSGHATRSAGFAADLFTTTPDGTPITSAGPAFRR